MLMVSSEQTFLLERILVLPTCLIFHSPALLAPSTIEFFAVQLSGPNPHRLQKQEHGFEYM